MFFDVEATGLSVTKDRIIELYFLKFYPDGSQENRHFLLNPGMHIPANIEKITGITNESVQGKPFFADIATELFPWLEDADLGGFNLYKLDLPMLMEEYARLGMDFSVENRQILDVQHIFHKMEPKNLPGIYKMYCGKEMTVEHSAV